MNITVALMALLLVMALGTVPKTQNQKLSELSGRGYTLLIPSELKAEKSYKVDFELTRITRFNGNDLLTVYSGLHPDFGSDAPRSAAYSKSSVNGMPAQRLTWTRGDGMVCAEVLVTLRSSALATLSAHFAYCLGSETERSLAESIIKSVMLEGKR
jgi:hypothetical protein